MRRRNLFTSDPSYSQSWSLDFCSPVTERRYQSDSARMRKDLLCIWTVGVAVVLGLLAATQVVSVGETMVVVGVLGASVGVRLEDPLRQRLMWCMPNLLLSHLYFLATQPSPWSQSDEFLRIFPSFLTSNSHTGFYTVRRWPISLLISFSESLLFSAISGISVWDATEVVVVFGVGYVLVARDFQDLWVLFDSYKRSEGHFQEVFNGAVEARFVTDKDGIILYCNTAGRRFAGALGQSSIHYSSTPLISLFSEENTAKLQEMLQTASKGESDEKEFILKRIAPGSIDASQIKSLGVEVRSQPMQWKRTEALLFSFEDVSLYIARRLFLTSIYRKLSVSISDFSSTVSRLVSSQQPPSATDISSLYFLYTDYSNSLLLQYYILGRVELRKEVFNLRTELENVLEFASFRSFDRNIDLSLTRQDGLPTTVFADKQRHSQLLMNLLVFSVEHAKESSEVTVTCAVEGIKDGEMMVNYKVAFLTNNLTQSDLESVLITRKGECTRRSLLDLLRFSDRFGVGIIVFDILVLTLRGYTTVASVVTESPGRASKALISFSLPIQSHSQAVSVPPVDLSPGKETVSPLITRWKCANFRNLHHVSSSPALISVMHSKRSSFRRQSPQTGSEIARFSPQPPPMSSSDRWASVSSASSEDGEARSVLVRRLDLSEAQFSPRGETASFHRPHISRLPKLLVVEDNAQLRRALISVVKRHGFADCDEAKDDTEALQMYRIMTLQNGLYFVIFVDLMAKMFSGSSAVQKIRDLEQSCSYPRTFICGITSDNSSHEPSLFDAFSNLYSVTCHDSDPEVQRTLRSASRR